MKNKTTIIFFIIFLLLSACAKEDNARKKIEGEYDFYHYEVDYYSNDGITITSTYKKDLEGIINLMTDNKPGSDWYNDCEYSLSEIPKGWLDNNIRTQTPLWHCDQGSMRVINFFKEPNAGNVIYATYTITKNGHKKYIFSYVSMDSQGKLIYEERLYLKKK